MSDVPTSAAALGTRRRIMPAPGRRGATLLPVLLLLILSLLGPVAAAGLPRSGQTQFAVVAAPWKRLTDMAALVATAEGEIVDAGGLSNVVIAHSDDPGFVAAAYRAGAWLVLDPVLLRGCLGFGGRAG